MDIAVQQMLGAHGSRACDGATACPVDLTCSHRHTNIACGDTLAGVADKVFGSAAVMCRQRNRKDVLVNRRGFVLAHLSKCAASEGAGNPGPFLEDSTPSPLQCCKCSRQVSSTWDLTNP